MNVTGRPPTSGHDPTRDGPLRIALIGTRGLPARYGGFETAVEQIGQRLVDRGHQVTVYCRTDGDEPRAESYLGMRLVHLPAVRRKTMETLSHTALSCAHAVVPSRPDVAVVFNAANAPLLPALRLRGVPVATHVDGLEWKRTKWSGSGHRYYRLAERLAVRWSDELIADAHGISDYYERRYGVGSRLIAYGAPVLDDPGADRIAGLELHPKHFHLVVARFEPENHVEQAVLAYLRSDAECPLVVVGSAPYSDDYTARIRALAEQNTQVRLLGPVWDQDLLDELYANCLLYVHGHSVGGTNPSLLRAMGAGSAVTAYDVNFNRDVLGSDGTFFTDPDTLADRMHSAEADPTAWVHRGKLLQERAQERYRWDDVADEYERLCRDLVAGHSRVRHRRSRDRGR